MTTREEVQQAVNSTKAPTYGRDDATKLRTIAWELFSEVRPLYIPKDIWGAESSHRNKLLLALMDLAYEIESAPGPVEIELVQPDVSPYTLELSRDILYLVRTALT